MTFFFFSWYKIPCIGNLRFPVFSLHFISDLKGKETFMLASWAGQRGDVAKIKGSKISECNLKSSQRIPSCRYRHTDRRHLTFLLCCSLCTHGQGPILGVLPGSCKVQHHTWVYTLISCCLSFGSWNTDWLKVSCFPFPGQCCMRSCSSADQSTQRSWKKTSPLADTSRNSFFPVAKEHHKEKYKY